MYVCVYVSECVCVCVCVCVCEDGEREDSLPVHVNLWRQMIQILRLPHCDMTVQSIF